MEELWSERVMGSVDRRVLGRVAQFAQKGSTILYYLFSICSYTIKASPLLPTTLQARIFFYKV